MQSSCYREVGICKMQSSCSHYTSNHRSLSRESTCCYHPWSNRSSLISSQINTIHLANLHSPIKLTLQLWWQISMESILIIVTLILHLWLCCLCIPLTKNTYQFPFTEWLAQQNLCQVNITPLAIPRLTRQVMITPLTVKISIFIFRLLSSLK